MLVRRQQEHSRFARLSGRQRIEVAFAIADPSRVDQLLTHGIHKLVGGANSSVANARYRGNLLRRLGLAHEMRCGVDARCCNGQWRSTGERANFVSFLRYILGNGSDSEVEAESIAEAVAKCFGINRLFCNVIVLGVDEFLYVHVSKTQ